MSHTVPIVEEEEGEIETKDQSSRSGSLTLYQIHDLIRSVRSNGSDCTT